MKTKMLKMMDNNNDSTLLSISFINKYKEIRFHVYYPFHFYWMDDITDSLNNYMDC